MTPIYFGEEPIKHLYIGSKPNQPIQTFKKGEDSFLVTTTTTTTTIAPTTIGPVYSVPVTSEFDLFPEE